MTGVQVLGGANSSAAVLHWRLGVLAQHREPARRRGPAGAIPPGDTPDHQVARAAELMRQRWRELRQLLDTGPPPPWATTLGPPPATSDDRRSWLTAATAIAAYRERFELPDHTDLLGQRPSRIRPDAQAAFDHAQTQLTPGTEAPAEMNFYFPDHHALCMAENSTHTLHNILTLRGAVVRDAHAWAHYTSETLALWGEDLDMVFASHHWPTWGRERCVEYLALQRDAYLYLHDQTLRMINQGFVGSEIAETLQMPPALVAAWHTHGYYGRSAAERPVSGSVQCRVGRCPWPAARVIVGEVDASLVGSWSYGCRRPLDAGDVGGEEVDAVAVEVAAGAVVVLGGAGVGVPGEDLGVTERDAGVESVGDGGVAKRMRADVPGDVGGFSDPCDHPVGVSAVDRFARVRP